jgi:hypothetical protein
MPLAAPRLDPRLLERLERLARSGQSVAEVRRALVALALDLGVPPPSYEHVRRLVTTRRIERESERELLPIVVGVATGTRHGNELLHAVRYGPPPSRRKSA